MGPEIKDRDDYEIIMKIMAVLVVVILSINIATLILY